MNWRKIIIGIIFILAIISVFIIRNISQADAAVNLGADIETIRDDDGSIYHIYNVYFTISANEEINHIEGTYEEIGLNVLEIESSGNFYAEYIDMDEKSFSFISNDVYTSSDGKVYFARVVSQYADPDYTEDCTLKFNALRDLVSTNDVDITKSAITSTDSLVNLDNVEFNEEFYYKITIQNTSPIPTDTINFIDQIPSELEVLDVDFNDILGNRSGNTITYTLDSLGVGEGKTIYIKVRLIDATGNTILNTASITVGDKEKSDDYELGILKPSLSITKEASADFVKRGDTFTYAITVDNRDATAYDVIVRDTIDSNFTIVSTSHENSGTDNNLVFELGDLTKESKETITITLRANEDAELQNFINVATVSATNHEDVQASDDVTVVDDDVYVAKSASKTTLRPGEEFSYYIEFGNTGDAFSDSITITDTIDSRLTIVSAEGASISGNTLTWEVSSLSPDEVNTYEIVVRVNDNVQADSVIENVVVLTEEDEQPLEDEVNVNVVDSNVTIEKTVNKSVVRPNEEFTYNVRVFNNGSAPSNNIIITDVIDSYLEIIAAPAASINGQTIIWTIPSLAAHDEMNFTITVKVRESVSDNTTINNVVTLTETGKPSISDEEEVIVRKPILRVEKTVNDNPAIYEIGEEFSYNIVVYNDGSLASDKVYVTDAINELLDIVDSDSGIVENNQISWMVDSIPAFDQVSFEVVVKAKENVSNNTTIKNTVVVRHDDEEISDDEDVVIVASDVYLVKSVSKNTLRPNEKFSYTITFGNNGDASVSDVVISDLTPDHITFLEAIPSSDRINIISNNEFRIDTLNPNEEFSIIINARVNSNASMDEIIKNIAILTTPDLELDSDVDITVIDSNLVIEKSSDKYQVVNNEEFNYTITITNNGTAVASNINVVDTFDSDLVVLACDNCNVVDNTLNWQIDNIAVNETVRFNVKVRVNNKNNGDIITNYVEATYDDKPSISDEVDVLVVDYKLSITKQVSKDLVMVDEEFKYYIKIKNESSVVVDNIRVEDIFNENLEIIDSANATINDGIYSWIISLLPNEEVVIEITAKVKEDSKLDEIPNTATLIVDEEITPSNEVIVKITTEEIPNNPSTGTKLNAILLIGSLILVVIGNVILKKKNRLFKV